MILENPQGEVQLFVSEENSHITLPKDIVGLIRIPAATHTTGVTDQVKRSVSRLRECERLNDWHFYTLNAQIYDKKKVRLNNTSHEFHENMQNRYLFQVEYVEKFMQVV